MKAEVQNELKKIRNKEEKANGKMKKNKQQLTDDSSMEKNREKLYDERTAINKKQQIDSITRGYDAQKKEATLVMKMNDKNVRIKLDTGAEVNVIPIGVFSQIANTEDVEQSKVKLKGYRGSAISVTGESFIRCAYNNIYKDVKFDIVESSSKTALGLESCQDFKLIKIMDEIKHSSTRKVQGDADSKKLETKTKSIKGLSDKALKKKIEEMYPEIFNGLGRLTEEYHIHIKENATPVIHSPRKIPVAIRDRLKKELDTMERNGVIKKI